MQRLDRLAALLTSLQSGRWKTAEQLASRYGVSLRTIYRDVRALQLAGVPVLSETGRGYTLMEGYRLPPVMFSRAEAVALLTGEKLLQKQSSLKLKTDYRAAMEKVRAVLRGTDKEFVEALDQKVTVYHYPYLPHSPRDEKLFDFLQEAVYRQQLLRITYQVPDRERTERVVQPLGLLQSGSYWYLAAWCMLRKGYRSFRLDRVEQYEITEEKITPVKGHTLEKFAEAYQRRGEGSKVVIWMAREFHRYLGEQKFEQGWISEQPSGTGVEITFLVDSLERFARWLLMWGNVMTVREPAALQERMATLAEELYAHYTAKTAG